MQKAITHKWFYDHAPEQVWEYLTKSELMAQWLMENDFLPIVGHEFQFRTRPMPNFGFDGIIYCKVLEMVPFKKLSYSWKGGPGNGKMTMDSVVVWTLEKKDHGTELLLNHSGFGEGQTAAIFAVMEEGWLKNIKKIAGLLNASTHDTSHA
jgi:uncharacterized protein YndB with AHSA1/START domain